MNMEGYFEKIFYDVKNPYLPMNSTVGREIDSDILPRWLDPYSPKNER